MTSKSPSPKLKSLFYIDVDPFVAPTATKSFDQGHDMYGTNPMWAQSNAPFLMKLVHEFRKAHETSEVVWMDKYPLAAYARVTRSNWASGRFPGRRNGGEMMPYEVDIVPAISTWPRQDVTNVTICELRVMIGTFMLDAAGRLLFDNAKGKGGAIKFNGFFLGEKTTASFRVKPSHQEKWERMTEGWDRAAWREFKTAIHKCAEVYRLYKTVMNRCAEYYYAQEVGI